MRQHDVIRVLILRGLMLLALGSPCLAEIDYFTGNVAIGEKQILNGDRPDKGVVNLTGRGRQVLVGRTLGLDFEVSAYGIVITQLGIWDDDVLDPATGEMIQELGSPHTLSVWDITTETLLRLIETEPETGRLRGDYRYFKLDDPLFLPFGSYFSIVVGYPDDNVDSNGNSGRVDQDLEPTPTVHDAHSMVIGVGGARFGFGDMGFPDILDTGPANRYHSGSFSYYVLDELALVPEPDTLALVALASLLGLLRLRRRTRERGAGRP